MSPVSAQDAGVQDQTEFQAAVRTTEPRNPEQQLSLFQLPDGFRITCFASEPQLQKPMNMAFDHNGRLWVTGSGHYPNPAPDGQGTDTVRILEDTTGDGQADKITTFAENLNIPIGLIPYGDGAIVFSIPDILYLEDSNGDGKADRTTKLYGPFDTTRDTHGMTNSFTAGHDGWIYACHGFNNQSTVSGSDGHSVTMHSGNTFRFRPDGSRIEIWTRGQVNPFGMTTDEFGDLYTSDCHSKPVNLLIPGGYHESFGKPHDGLGFIPDVMSHQHGSTAIDGVCWYGGQMFPEEYRGNLFLGNVMTGRVHRNQIVRSGSTISLEQKDDLIICGDPWFRPVDIQVGPDGAVYIADFYNRIIGHYEVPLDHPGRDRVRGRIWKLTYQGSTSSSTEDASLQLSNHDVSGTMAMLQDPRLQVRMRATDRLVRTFSGEAADLARQQWDRTQPGSQSSADAHVLWILYRLNKLRPEDVEKGLQSQNEITRIHIMKICAELADVTGYAESIKAGLRDPDFRVQRAAASAAAQHPDVLLFKELVNAFTVCPAQDVHLKHAVKIALRNQLLDPEIVKWFLASEQPTAAYAACQNVLEGIQTPSAADLVLAVVSHLDLPADTVSRLVIHAAKNAQPEQVDPLIRVAAELPLGLTDNPVQIRDALAEIFERHPEANRALFDVYEAGLLNKFVSEIRVESLHWGRYQWDDRPAVRWGLEQRSRASGREDRFLSSLPGGENGVGVLRSKSFVVPFQFQLELCGHLGRPQQPAVLNNRLVLRDSQTGKEIRTAFPPRNDQATKFEWTLADVVGRRAVLELEDGIDEPAYAWLALGHMSPAVANSRRGPQEAEQNRLFTVIQILQGRAQQGMLQEDRLQLLSEAVQASQVDGVTRQIAADILFRQRGLEQLAPLSVLLKYGRVSLPVSQRIADACATADPWIVKFNPRPFVDQESPFDEPEATASEPEDSSRSEVIRQTDPKDWEAKLIRQTFEELPRFYQRKLASAMAENAGSSSLLLRAIEGGVPSASILQDQTLVALLKSHGDAMSQTVDTLLKTVPAEESVPDEYRQSVLDRLKNIDPEVTTERMNQGQVLFDRHCAACHRRGSKGGVAGPQLDGIRTRGAERMLEDILYPHRNVDLAFRASVITLKSGKSVSGIVRPGQREGELTVVDTQGKSIVVKADEIEQQSQTRQSLMPSGFHRTLSEAEMTQLMTWLLN